MALWDSGIWDSSKWSTIETTVAIPLDGVTVASTGKVVHVATAAITLDDITIASSGVITRHATIEITLEDINVAVAGQNVHAGPLSLILDDVTYSSSGQIVHNASLAIALDDISVQMLGSVVHEGNFSLTLEDIAVYFQTFVPQHRGGTGKKKSKVYKDLRQEVEDDIANAIAKVTGEDIPPELEEISLEAEIKVAEEANIARLQERVMQAQAMALQAEIDRLIQDELDDEESLMLLL
jgi:hypothetical protein